jgi:cobalt/nickel transport system permease protein
MKLAERDARIKIALSLAGVILSLAARTRLTPALIGACALGSLLLALPLGRVLRALSALVLTIGVPLVATAWLHGSNAALELGARVCGAAGSGLWLVMLTDAPSLAAALAWYRVPAAIVELLVMAARQAHVLKDTITTAQDAMAMRLGHHGVRRRIRSAGVLAGLVVSRAVDQSTVVAEALAMRGYQGRLATGTPPALTRADGRLAVAAAALLLACSLGGHL